MITKRGGSLYENREAIFSDDMRHRYSLKILWHQDQSPNKILPVIGLNPSHADEMKNDLTIGKLCKMAKAWRFAGLLMLNLYAYRSPDPRELWEVDDPIGEHNTFEDLVGRIQDVRAKEVLCAWGSIGLYQSRGANLAAICRGEGLILWCLRKNPDGTPIHPLARGRNHVPINSVPIEF